MRKKLSAIGNSLGIVIEKPILDLLGLDRHSEFEMTTDGDRLMLVPIRKPRKQRAKEALEEVLKDHATTFRKLAK
jgi:antitoxin component of MazEF toxin-antitoxin module